MTTKFLPLFFIFNIFIASLFGQLKVNSNGNVGIGTNPNYKLDVAGSINANGSILSTGSITTESHARIGGDFYVGLSGERLFINKDNGNVSIGNASTSSYKLDVAGDIHSSTNIITDGQLTANNLNVINKITSNSFPLVIGNDVPSEHTKRFATFYDNTMDNNKRSINFGKSAYMFQCGELSYTQSTEGFLNNMISLGFYGLPPGYGINISGGGKVGIGTTNFDDDSKLFVDGKINVNGIYSYSSVGIGVSQPKAKLDVLGNINISIPPSMTPPYHNPSELPEMGLTSLLKLNPFDNLQYPNLSTEVNFSTGVVNNQYRGAAFTIDTRPNHGMFHWSFREAGSNVNNRVMVLGNEGLLLGDGLSEYMQAQGYKLAVWGKTYCAYGLWVGSDPKLKENIEPFNIDIANKVSKLKAYRYNYKENKQSKQKRIGFLANEVKDQFPELVNESADGTLALDYMGMIPILLEAIKEIDVKTEHLKVSKKTTDSLVTVINTMDKNYKSLEQRVKALEGCVNCTGNQKSAEYTNIPVETINSLSQNSPNPFSEQTSISYTIADDVKKATIYVYDMQGKQKKSYPITTRGQGSLTIQGYEYVAGMYMYSMVTDGNEVDTKRMILTE